VPASFLAGLVLCGACGYLESMLRFPGDCIEAQACLIRYRTGTSPGGVARVPVT
jgi:hypothetical protein